MKKLIYLIVVIVASGLIVSGCIPLVPPLEQNELSSTASKVTVVSEGGEEYINVITNGHKIMNKWDLKGNFVAHPSYTWGGLAPNAMWEYSIHIKEAMNGNYSVGSIRFTTGDIEVIGHVKQTKIGYNYSLWADWDTLAAAGTTEYNSETYNFIFLFSPHAMQFTISNDETFIIGGEIYYFDDLWQADKYFPSPQRNYDLHSGTVIDQFADIWDPKNIH